MTAGEIEQLAREYATTRPAALRMNYGVQRSENGGTAVRAIAMLPALTGAWKYRGGGGSLSTSGAFAWNKRELERLDLALDSPLGRPARVVNMSLLGKALNQGIGIREQEVESDAAETQDDVLSGGPPVNALFVYNSNPGAVAPNQNAVRRGLARQDLFTVVHEQFFNDTTDYADYVLPATTFLEHTDIQGAYGHYFVQLSNQAIEPPGEARSNVWLFGQLAQYMGFTEPCFRDSEEQLIRQALSVGLDGRSKNRGDGAHHASRICRRRGTFRWRFIAIRRASHLCRSRRARCRRLRGRSSFIPRRWPRKDRIGLPAFMPPTESRWRESAKRFPLEFLGRKADNYMNSTFANLEGHRKMEARTSQRLEMHPIDAKARGIADGDTVRVWNDRGEIQLTALVDGSVA